MNVFTLELTTKMWLIYILTYVEVKNNSVIFNLKARLPQIPRPKIPTKILTFS